MRTLVAAAVAVIVMLVFAASAMALDPGTGGQPSQTCLSPTAMTEPGNAAGASGSAFNENGGTAGAMYAGTQPQNSVNQMAVSQYDVACFQVSNR